MGTPKSGKEQGQDQGHPHSDPVPPLHRQCCGDWPCVLDVGGPGTPMAAPDTLPPSVTPLTLSPVTPHYHHDPT